MARLFNPRKAVDWIGLSFIIIVILIAIAIFVPFENVDAATRSDITETKKQVTTLENKVKELDNKISAQKITIQGREKILNEAKEKERQTRQELNTSYKAFEELENIKQEIIKAEQSLKEANTQLQNLLNERNTTIKQIKELEKTLGTQESEIRLQQKQNLSGLKRIIGVYISNSCITMLKNNITTSCPSNYDLELLDTSNKDVSGYFKEINGFYQRERPKYENSWQYYKFLDEFMIVSDPPQSMHERIPTIEIRPNFDTYYQRGSMTQDIEYGFVDIIINNTKTNTTKTVTIYDKTKDFATILYHDRFIDSRCEHAIINADKYIELIADTIHHMRSGCTPNSTTFNEKEIIYPTPTEFNLEDSAAYQYKAWLENVTRHCIYKYKACTE